MSIAEFGEYEITQYQDVALHGIPPEPPPAAVGDGEVYVWVVERHCGWSISERVYVCMPGEERWQLVFDSERRTLRRIILDRWEIAKSRWNWLWKIASCTRAILRGRQTVKSSGGAFD